MKQQVKILTLTLLMLLVLDAGVAGVLYLAEREGRLGALVNYFEHGRSVPGKIHRWRKSPGINGNLLEVAWRDDILAYSRERFSEEPEKPTIRSYGFSFVNQILRSAQVQEPDLILDLHAGPAAPPNFTYALFEDDAANRREGDVAVLGIFSSGIPSMSSLSNRTRVFEQPAPFTYPIYRPGEKGLTRLEPLVTSLEEENNLIREPRHAENWAQQLRQEDRFYSSVAFEGQWLDRSPFMRLIRRSAAIGTIDARTRAILADPSKGGFPYRETLRRMAVGFAARARADGQHPMIFLIQTRDLTDPDLRAILYDTLDDHDIPYLATSDYYDIRNEGGFLPDGHYKTEINRLFAEEFRKLVYGKI